MKLAGRLRCVFCYALTFRNLSLPCSPSPFDSAFHSLRAHLGSLMCHGITFYDRQDAPEVISSEYPFYSEKLSSLPLTVANEVCLAFYHISPTAAIAATLACPVRLAERSDVCRSVLASIKIESTTSKSSLQ